MRLNTRTSLGLLIALAMAVALVWKFHRAPHADGPATGGTPAPAPLTLRVTNFVPPQAVALVAPAPVIPNTPFTVIATNFPNAPFTNVFAHRLTNSALPFEELLRSDFSVLLRNALLDTRLGAPAIPEHLRAAGDPGAYIVQARGVITDEFRAALKRAGAEVVSYVPNNALLVRATAGAAQVLRGSPLAQAVLPFEPYYKLDARLLALAVNHELSPHGLVNVVTFPNETARARAALEKIGAEIVAAPEPTIFGDVLIVKAGADRLADVAQISEVQMVGVNYEKRVGNDLARVIVRVSTNIPLTTNVPIVRPPQSHYRSLAGTFLTGQGVLVGVNDSGADLGHPDLTNRVTGLSPDFEGHGTHVIGTLLGDGTASPLIGKAARGSLTNAVFSGMAPAAQGFMQDFRTQDTVLQRNTALKEILISNNSWGRPGDNDYDIYAANFDAAVRDSLPGVLGEQEVMYVFAAGNEGGGGANGLNGLPGSITSPSTAKNVITVGATDLPRFITNAVRRACQTVTNNLTNIVIVCETNFPWYGMTDTNNQVSPYSSRGNVGIGTEGLYGRFKPDVVAPGSMLVSARSSDYVEPDGITNTYPYVFNGLTIGFNRTNLFAINVPRNAISVTILTVTNAASPTNLALTVSAYYDPTVRITGTNGVILNGSSSPALIPGTLYYTVANQVHSNGASYDLVLLLTTTNDVGDYFTVLKQLNEPLKPYYRYEAGTSMAAPVVSGMLALVQEFFTNQFPAQQRPSPALLKALLINGARSLSANYNLHTAAPINHQGWGLVNMSNTIPAGLAAGSNGPLRFYDQRTTNALATGDSETYTVTVPNAAKSAPLRITLVWTDPPGNPLTGIKLVNDLNLTVLADTTNRLATNLTTSNSLYWVGNNFPPGSDFTDPLIAATTDTNRTAVSNFAAVAESVRDVVNNVENVFISPPLASTYTIVVKGHRVNVNAVNSNREKHVQDYALVVSSGNVASNANLNLALTPPAPAYDPAARLTVMQPVINSNNPVQTARASLLNQRVGANNPLIVSTNGATNQWCFFTFKNVDDSTFTNVVILTFLAPELSLPRNREADIDLYVIRGGVLPNAFDLTNLNENVISACVRSVGRGGTEFVYFTNAQAGEVFYIGVKSEDQQAANFSIYAESRNGPFSTRGSNGIVASWFGPQAIPDGTPDTPGGTTNPIVIIVDPRDSQLSISRVYVTNATYHEEAGDLIGVLNKLQTGGGDGVTGTGGPKYTTLFDHRTWYDWENPLPPFGVVYDDTDLGDLGDELSTPPVRVPDGPGRLIDFIGEQAGPVWDFTVVDNALFHTGFVQEVTLVIEPSSTNNDPNVVIDRRICVPPGGWRYEAVNIDSTIFNMEICLSQFESAPLALPIAIYVRQGNLPDFGSFDHLFSTGDPSKCFNISLADNPPLTPGRWYIGYYNSNANEQCFRERVTLSRRAIPAPYSTFYSTNMPMTLLDDATTNSTIFISQTGRIADLRVGLRVAHERAADLAFHLRSPNGTRVLLFENRGRTNAAGIGGSASNVFEVVGRTLINSGFDDAEGSGGGTRTGPNITYNLGEFVSGWRVDAENIEVVHDTYGMLTNRSHTGTNAIDLNGLTGPGAISTNVVTVSNQTYRLSFAFCKNPGGGAQEAAVQIQSADFFNFSYALVNDYTNPNWQTTSVVFRASSTNTRIGFRQIPPGGVAGMFIDSVRLEEYTLTTNLFLYTTFTENTNLTTTPIKFGLSPFTNSFNPSFAPPLDDGFEFLSTYVQVNNIAIPAGTLLLNTDISGWHVDEDDVDVLNSNDGFGPAHTGTHFLDLNGLEPGTISTNVPTEIGSDYELRFAFRRNTHPTAPPPVADVRVIGASSSLLTNLVVNPLVTNIWFTTSMVFRANSVKSRVEARGLSPLSDSGVFVDSFVMQKLNLDPALQAYFLPEEPLTPIFGQNSFGLWTLEAWDSRLGPNSGSLSNVLVSWKLEISYPGFNPPFILITNPISQTVTSSVAGDGTVYFAVDLPCFSGIVTNTLQNITGAGGLDLTFNQFTLPTNGPTDEVLLTGVTGTRSNELTIGSPPLISLTRYYLAVRNSNPASPSNQFVLRVDFACAQTNTFPFLTTNSYCTNIAARGDHIYRYEMPANVLGVRFETFGADGNVNMAVQANGVPSGGSGVTSTQPGLANEAVVVMTNLPPMPVEATTWYIAIRNQDATNVSYCLKITEIYDIPRLTLNVASNQIIQPNSINYYVVDVDGDYCGLNFTATGMTNTLLLYIRRGDLPKAIPGGGDLFAPAPPGYGPLTNALRGDWYLAVVNTNAVLQNYAVLAFTNRGPCFVSPVGPAIQTSRASYSASGFKLKWSAGTSEHYQVQYTDSLAPVSWQTITNVITSGDGNFEFTDPAATTNAQRFYRLRRVP